MKQKLATIWIVSPFYHDGAAFLAHYPIIINSIRADVLWRFYRIRFLLVDDSQEESVAIASIKSLPGVSIFSPPHCLGQQAALTAGMRILATFCDEKDFVVSMDADGEDQATDVVKMLDHLKQTARDMSSIVLAQSLDRDSSGERPAVAVMRWIYQQFFYLLTGRRFSTRNFAAMRGWTVKNLFVHPSFDLAYATSITRLVSKPIFMTCDRGRRLEGRSRFSWKKRLALAMQLLMPFCERITLRLQVFKIFTFLLAVGGVLLTGSAGSWFVAVGVGGILLALVFNMIFGALTESMRANLGPKIELAILYALDLSREPRALDGGAEVLPRSQTVSVF